MLNRSRHVRSFEVWRDRNNWNEWKTYNFERPIEQDVENQPLSWKWRIGELTTYTDLLSSHITQEEIELAQTLSLDGHDGFLKAILLAYCPRLQDIKVVTQSHDQGSTIDWMSTIQSSALSQLCFSPVRTVAVGIPSETWMDSQSDPVLTPQFLNYLLRFPNLESIYFNDFRCELEVDGTIQWRNHIFPKSSNVKHIFLDDCNIMPFTFQDALAAGPKELISFSFRAGTGSGDRMDDADRMVSFLGYHDCQSSSLRSLMFYGFTPDNTYERIHGYRCSVYLPEELRAFHALRDVSIDIQDIELEAFGSFENDNDEGKDKETFWKEWVIDIFPKSMETLTLWNETGSGHFGDEAGEVKFVEMMVIAMIESGRFPKLSAFYLEEVERSREGPRTDEICFQRAMEVGQEHGVDVYTLTNRRKPRHEQVFPEAPDKYDLVTGPYGGVRPSDFVFDVYQGRKVPPGCGKCGSCEVCLQQYSKELWGTVPKA
jgi:hypothetical protein